MSAAHDAPQSLRDLQTTSDAAAPSTGPQRAAQASYLKQLRRCCCPLFRRCPSLPSESAGTTRGRPGRVTKRGSTPHLVSHLLFPHMTICSTLASSHVKSPSDPSSIVARMTGTASSPVPLSWRMFTCLLQLLPLHKPPCPHWDPATEWHSPSSSPMYQLIAASPRPASLIGMWAEPRSVGHVVRTLSNGLLLLDGEQSVSVAALFAPSHAHLRDFMALQLVACRWLRGSIEASIVVLRPGCITPYVALGDAGQLWRHDGRARLSLSAGV